MPLTTKKTAAPDEVSSEELNDLQARFRSEGDIEPDAMPHGTTTIASVAEALGVSRDEVVQQLRQIRAEYSLAPPIERKTSQAALAGLAAVLFLAAWAIHVLTPHRMTEEEIDANLAEARAARKARPVHITYPIEHNVSFANNPLPPGMRVEFRGLKTHTVASNSASKPMTQEEATKRLIEVTTELFSKALKYEQDAPAASQQVIAKSFPFGAQVPPVGTFTFTMFNEVGMIPTAVSSGQTEQQLAESQQYNIATMARSVVQGAWDQQQSQLGLSNKFPRPPAAAGQVSVDCPPGVILSINGKHSSQWSSNALTLLPIDMSAFRRRLEGAVESAIRWDTAPMDFFNEEQRQADLKKPVPAWTEIRLSGPFETVTAKVPSGSSSEYPTAFQRTKAGKRIVDEMVDKVCASVSKLNSGG